MWSPQNGSGHHFHICTPPNSKHILVCALTAEAPFWFSNFTLYIAKTSLWHKELTCRWPYSFSGAASSRMRSHSNFASSTSQATWINRKCFNWKPRSYTTYRKGRSRHLRKSKPCHHITHEAFKSCKPLFICWKNQCKSAHNVRDLLAAYESASCYTFHRSIVNIVEMVQQHHDQAVRQDWRALICLLSG